MKSFGLALVLSLFFVSGAWAQTTEAGVAPLETLAKQAIVVEGKTGDVLYEKDADASMPTSSMSKVLTMYLVFEAIKDGKLSLDTPVTVSEAAWKQVGSRTFLSPNEQVKVEDLIRGLIIQSGNDSAVALAEAVAGSESSFAVMMNDKAKQLGMTHSHFANATGLPDPEHYSTARDLSILAQALMRDFPEYYHYYSETEFTYHGIKQGNRNPLLYRNIGADGMKTGHTDAAGYGLIATVLRDGRRILAVVNGLSSMQERADEPTKLIDWAYREYELFTPVVGGEKVGEAPVWLGKLKTVPVAPEKGVTFSLKRANQKSIKVDMSVYPEVEAPVAKGQVMGKAVVSADGIASIEVPLVATEDVQRLGWFDALIAKIKRKLGKA